MTVGAGKSESRRYGENISENGAPGFTAGLTGSAKSERGI